MHVGVLLNETSCDPIFSVDYILYIYMKTKRLYEIITVMSWDIIDETCIVR